MDMNNNYDPNPALLSIDEDNQWGKKPEHSTSNYSLGNNPKDW